MNILKAGLHAEVRVAVPFTQIVEATVLGAGSFEEGRKGFIVLISVAHKLSTRAAGCVYREINDHEALIADLFTHQNPANLA